MTDRGRRLGKGIAIALAVHIVAAALLGILGYRFTQRPPQILEVTLGGGGGGGGKGSAAAEKGTAETAASAAVQQQKQQSAPVRTDDIVDRKQKPVAVQPQVESGIECALHFPFQVGIDVPEAFVCDERRVADGRYPVGAYQSHGGI